MNATTRTLLKWELRWIPVEMAMIAVGLFLQLKLHLDEAGAYMLFAAVAISGTVRLAHYLRPPSKGSYSRLQRPVVRL